jgi:hypothetical protein
MDEQISSAIKRARSYWFVDGFTEMLAGVLLILVGGVVWLRSLAPQASFPVQFASITVDVTLVKIIGLSGAVLVVWWLKNRFTYPRTGFVREKRVTAAQMFAFIGKTGLAVLLPVLAVVAAFVFVPAVRASIFTLPLWLPPVFGVFWAVLALLAGQWMGLSRFRLLGAWMLLAGLAAGGWQFLVGVPDFPPEALQSGAWAALPPALVAALATSFNRTFASVGLLVLLTGLGLGVSGGVTFLRYRQANPVPYEEEA